MAALGQSKCPTGCGRSVLAGHLMCRTCWGKVPRDLQQRVYGTWRAWKSDLDDQALMSEYREARDNALAAVA
ncbi:MAG: hypothetical protein ABIN55_01775 [Aeromicrobium sp.]